MQQTFILCDVLKPYKSLAYNSKYEFVVTVMTAIRKVSRKNWLTYCKAVIFSVAANSYLLLYASDLHGFNQSHTLEVFCINICCFILAQMNQE